MANTYTSLFYHIQNQRDHHQNQDFQAEYLEFLRRHEVEYDERYVWG